MSAGAEAGAPAVTAIELGDVAQQAIGRRVDVGRELGDLVLQLIERAGGTISVVVLESRLHESLRREEGCRSVRVVTVACVFSTLSAARCCAFGDETVAHRARALNASDPMAGAS